MKQTRGEEGQRDLGIFVGGEGEKMGLLVGARNEKTLCSICFLSVSKMRKQFQTASHKTWVETRLVMGHYDCAAG